MSKTTYIETELGLLPSDWKIRTLGEVAPLQRGFDLPASELKKGPYPVVYSNGILNYHHIGPCVAPGLVTGRSGTIGKFTYISEGRYWPHNTALWVTSFKDNCPLFVRYLFETVNFGAYSTGTGVPTLNRNDLHTCTVSLPPTKAEQTAIAEALSDIDSLIRNFDRTIAKKQNIRQGAMEQLLSGQLRLPGFKKKWVDNRIGELAIVNSGGTPDSSNPEYYGGKIKFLSIGDMTNSRKYITSTEKSITESGLKNSSARLFPSGTLMYAIYASLGKCSISMTEMAISQAILGFKLSNKIDRDYLYFYLCSIESKVKTIGQTGTQANLSKSIVENLDIYLPTDLKEQQAIADTLTAMDDEIAMLQLERDKYANIRAGMMDELLSGKKRLI